MCYQKKWQDFVHQIRVLVNEMSERSHFMKRSRGQRTLGALIAAGLALGGASAHAETVTEDHHTIAVTSNKTNVYGGRILVQEAQEGFGTYRANGNSITVSAQGSQEGQLYAATIEQRAAQD